MSIAHHGTNYERRMLAIRLICISALQVAHTDLEILAYLNATPMSTSCVQKTQQGMKQWLIATPMSTSCVQKIQQGMRQWKELMAN
jgi:hypothetical protein